MLGFTGKLTDILQGLRVKELKLAARFRRLFCAGTFFSEPCFLECLTLF
jgi:hypothetical protein